MCSKLVRLANCAAGIRRMCSTLLSPSNLAETAQASSTTAPNGGIGCQPTETLKSAMETDEKLRAKVERIQKEFELYEYFTSYEPPQKFTDRHWDQLLQLTLVKERVDYFWFMSLTEYKEGKSEQKEKRLAESHQQYMEEQDKMYEAGGMGYSSKHHRLMYNPLGKTLLGLRMRHKILTDRLAVQMQLGELPHLLFDCQFLPSAVRHYLKIVKTGSHAFHVNRWNRMPFPSAFINANPNDKRTRNFFFAGKIIGKAQNPLYSDYNITPNFYRNDPFHLAGEKDPREQVIYISKHAHEFLDGPLIHKAYVIPLTFDHEKESVRATRHGRYRAMALPLRQYLKWKCGPVFVPWLNMINIFAEVASNGGDWEYALRKNISQRYLQTHEERVEQMGRAKYEHKVINVRVEKNRMTDLIKEAIGEQPLDL